MTFVVNQNRLANQMDNQQNLETDNFDTDFFRILMSSGVVFVCNNHQAPLFSSFFSRIYGWRLPVLSLCSNPYTYIHTLVFQRYGELISKLLTIKLLY